MRQRWPEVPSKCPNQFLQYEKQKAREVVGGPWGELTEVTLCLGGKSERPEDVGKGLCRTSRWMDPPWFQLLAKR